MRVGFLGPQGTFCEEALAAFGDFGGGEPLPFPTERAAILAAAAGEVDAAMVPIENALEGSVNATLDALIHDAPEVRILGEHILPVRHRLAAREGVALADITAVISHPQALAQCSHFLDEQLPDATRIAASSTAEGMRMAGVSEEPVAAIGTFLAAVLYGCVELADHIEDDPSNETRFVLVGNPARPPVDDAELPHKTTLVFQGEDDTSPGWLVRCLSEFAFRGINLTKIESRPQKRRLGHYLFLLDCDGDATDELLGAAIEGLRAHCGEVRVLGSYRAA